MDFSLTIRREVEGTVVRVRGDLDVTTAGKLRERLTDLVRRGHYDLVVDLEGVSFLDAAGLAVLAHALKRARAHDGSLRVVCTNQPLLQIFRITHLTKTFPIHTSTREALAAIEFADTPPGVWVSPPRSTSPAYAWEGSDVGR